MNHSFERKENKDFRRLKPFIIKFEKKNKPRKLCQKIRNDFNKTKENLKKNPPSSKKMPKHCTLLK